MSSMLTVKPLNVETTEYRLCRLSGVSPHYRSLSACPYDFVGRIGYSIFLDAVEGAEFALSLSVAPRRLGM